ncbi:MAG: hypothetical protein K8S21_11720 [Gemmatimonadetes bacterium]|nr:hypothetical protein [Gemmatimonadota bacterium]
MSIPRLLPFAVAGATAFALHAAPLRVIRSTPTGVADPVTEISVSFDRPVAGSIERAVDPATVLRITPAIEGRFEWRDPVTVRFVPKGRLPADLRVTVEVGTDFAAMDGNRLAEPHRFAFRVRGPRLLTGSPVGEDASAAHVTPAQRFEVVYSDSVDAARLAEVAFIEMAATCTPRVLRMRAAGQRRIEQKDGWDFLNAGGYARERSLDSLRRVIALVPRTPVPRGCAGELVLPEELSAIAPAVPKRWGFRSYGALALSSATCAAGGWCPRGPVSVSFSNPVSGEQLLRYVKLIPAVPLVVRDSTAVSTTWVLEGQLTPRTAYAIVVDTALRDVFGQRITGNPAAAVLTTGYEPYVNYPYGRQTVERVGFRTLPVQHANADTLVAVVAPVPRRLEKEFLARGSWGYGQIWDSVAALGVVRRIPVTAGRDRGSLTGLSLPVADATRADAPTLYAVKVGGSALAKGDAGLANATIALVQVTDLGVTARLGAQEGMVWVTGVSDGKPRANAEVTLHGPDGAVLATARTDAQGLAQLRDFAETLAPPDAEDGEYESPEGGYVAVRSGSDRALVAVNQYDEDLNSWSFGIGSAWGGDRFPIAGAVFAERGIYRPGEQVHLKAIVRAGPLGALRRPARVDSVRWVLSDREDNDTFTRTAALSDFGTAQHVVELPANAPVGTHRVRIMLKRRGAWRAIASTNYRVGEYRPPEFLVDLAARTPTGAPGGDLRFGITARYLFGAPMAKAQVNWEAREERVWPWELSIPGLDGWMIGNNTWDSSRESGVAGNFASGVDTLDDRGDRTITVRVPARSSGVTSRVVLAGAVTDVNRQVVGSVTSAIVHPARFYIASRVAGASWFWRADDTQRVQVRTVRPDGATETGVRVTGQIVRREWHRVRRERNGVAEMIAEWVTDTVGTCNVITAAEPVECAVTPRGGGVHTIEFRAVDADGRAAVTSFSRWVTGPGFVPWSDETQFKMELLADRDRYAVGDTATVMIASPFTDAEAWVTVEREQIIDQRRIRITSGSQTIKVPITEAFVPNAFVSVVVVRGRSAPPGKLDDPGRPTMRVGYVELRVTPEIKRLRVGLTLSKPDYRPGDTAVVKVAVRDVRGVGARSEVALWAVDEGVLALTGYKTPDPLDLIYRRRDLGMRLASNLVSVTPQVAEGEKGRRAPGGGGGADGAEVLRSKFKTTAFYLGDVVTDSAGNAETRAKLPDNLTTFRLMAVAVTESDRYGSGESPMLVTRPVVARPALPRFVRPGDTLQAGTVVNRRDGTVAQATVKAQSTGVRLLGAAERTVALAAGRGGEARFRYVAVPGDSAAFRFDVRSARDVDAVRVAVPVKPDFFARSHVIAGMLRDTATVEFALPAGIDPARSRITISMGNTPMAIVRGIRGALKVYEYECTEQISSRVTPLLALLRAEGALTPAERVTARAEIARGIAVLLGRQRADGGIGYWGSGDWTTPWLTAYAAGVIAEAKDLGIAVDSLPLSRLTEYLRTALREAPADKGPLSYWYDRRATRLADQVAAADVLSRLGAADRPAENELLRNAPQMLREDRIRLAELLARRGATDDAKRLLTPVWAQVRMDGRSAALPADTTHWYFNSTTRETARLLTATLAADPGHALVGPLVEWLSVSRADRYWSNTQDLAAAVRAIAMYDARVRAEAPRPVVVRSGARQVLRTVTARGDTTLAVAPLLGPVRDETRTLRLSLSAEGASALPSYYHVTVNEVPLAPPVRPADAGIRVERWYERYNDARPVTSVVEGELVRVRLRITVPVERRFVVVDDALPAGLEAIDLSLRTSAVAGGPGASAAQSRDPDAEGDAEGEEESGIGYGRYEGGWWSPWDFREIRDDRVVWSASWLWKGTWDISYIARATTPGTFVRPPARAEEMYDPGVNGRSDGGRFTVTPKAP